MHVLLINTSEKTGGAAIACNRLMEALNKNGIKAKMLVRDKQTDDMRVAQTKDSWKQRFNFLWERFLIFLNNRLHKKGIFLVDIANVGTDVTELEEFKEADIIHLHWTNQGFLSLSSLRKIMESSKPVVITMHDQWYFTGICHYSNDCIKYQSFCTNCEQLKGGGITDVARRIYEKKRKMYADADVTFVGCSKWIAELAAKSNLTKGKFITNIPNAIDTNVFHPLDSDESRKHFNLPTDRKLLLFGAQRITDERKGFKYLVEACERIKEQQPGVFHELGVVVVGDKSEEVNKMLPLPVFTVPYISDEHEMVKLYNAVDIYVTPSLQDNLPNTIVEAMSCGTPCVGFNVGGIPEMIDHEKNGYVAEYLDAIDFAKGIVWTLSINNYKELCTAAHEKATSTYSESSVARKYTEIYDNACHSNI